MASMWYYAKGDQQFGPIAEAQLAEMVRTGQLLGDDLVWAEGMPQWVPANAVPQFRPQGPVAPLQASSIGYTVPTPMNYAGPAPMNYAVKPPKNWLIEAILCLCCCWPFAIVAIVFAAQVNGKYRAGDVRGAEESAANARKWVMVSFWIGLVIGVIRLIMLAIAMANKR